MMIRAFGLGVVVSAACFAIAAYLLPGAVEQQTTTETSTKKPLVLPKLKPQREAAVPPPGTPAVESVVRGKMEAYMAAVPALRDQFLAEPLDDAFAKEQEPLIWERVSKLEGVQGATVECRTYHCQVTVTGDAKPSISLEVPGMTFRGTENGKLVFLYNPDLAAAE